MCAIYSSLLSLPAAEHDRSLLPEVLSVMLSLWHSELSLWWQLEGGLEDSWEGGFDLVGVFSSDAPFYTALLLFKGIRHPYGVGVVQQNVVIKESGGDVLPFRFIEEDMAFHLCEVLMMYLNE